MKFKSSCRICGSWRVNGKHFKSYNPNSRSLVVYMEGYYEECVPSDNLEYLEWCYDKKGEGKCIENS